MIKILFYLAAIGIFVLYFFFLTHLPKVKWWKDLIALFITIGIYSFMVYVYFEEQRIGWVTLMLSTFLLVLFFYKGCKSILHKLKNTKKRQT